MAINQNHLFEELNGIKCGIVEKNVKPDRVSFLKSLLEFNGFTVVVAPTPPPKAVAPSPQKEGEAEQAAVAPSPETFTVGVTDITFNTINAIFGRLLRAPGGHIVTLAYWQQHDNVSRDDIPYFQK